MISKSSIDIGNKTDGVSISIRGNNIFSRKDIEKPQQEFFIEVEFVKQEASFALKKQVTAYGKQNTIVLTPESTWMDIESQFEKVKSPFAGESSGRVRHSDAFL
ncbi:MAG: hypothetical protein EOO39_41590, partial [Cytophagaceae bacterium]